MSNIQAMVNELQSIRGELKTLRLRGMTLRKKQKEIESDIASYLESKSQPGIKYKNIAIIKETKTYNKIKKKADQKYDMARLAEDFGIKDTDKFLEELDKVKKGSPEERSKLKLKTIKQKKGE